jgi:hypothetical protein
MQQLCQTQQRTHGKESFNQSSDQVSDGHVTDGFGQDTDAGPGGLPPRIPEFVLGL